MYEIEASRRDNSGESENKKDKKKLWERESVRRE